MACHWGQGTTFFFGDRISWMIQFGLYPIFVFVFLWFKSGFFCLCFLKKVGYFNLILKLRVLIVVGSEEVSCSFIWLVGDFLVCLIFVYVVLIIRKFWIHVDGSLLEADSLYSLRIWLISRNLGYFILDLSYMKDKCNWTKFSIFFLLVDW